LRFENAVCAKAGTQGNLVLEETMSSHLRTIVAAAVLSGIGFLAGCGSKSNPMPYNCTNPGASSYLYAAVAGGGGPVSVAVDPAGAFVYLGMQPSPIAGTQGLSVLRIDGTSGALTALAGSPFATDQFFYGVAIAKP
jgi:hypothetical protein